MAWIGALVAGVGMLAEGQAKKQAGFETAKEITRRKVREGDASLTEEKDYRDREKRLLATGRVIGAAQGTTSEGSPLQIASDYAGELEEQAMRIKHGGELVQSRMAEQANLALRTGRREARASYTRAGGTLLKGAYSVYGGTA